ncbi:hypothetical protein HC891_21555 [Candidatus Gracilibacteria bacterium]|nr:hypothetical protein [Candidatus Gracilibacteria bacterium]
MRPKGLRNLRTVQQANRRNQIGSREQMVAELARLEHEKARLQREVEVWRQNQRRTETQLEHVEARLAQLARAIDLTGAESVPANRDNEAESRTWLGMTLEY